MNRPSVWWFDPLAISFEKRLTLDCFNPITAGFLVIHQPLGITARECAKYNRLRSEFVVKSNLKFRTNLCDAVTVLPNAMPHKAHSFGHVWSFLRIKSIHICGNQVWLNIDGSGDENDDRHLYVRKDRLRSPGERHGVHHAAPLK